MANYRVRETGEVLTQGQVRQKHWNTSFPAVWNQSVCEHIGIDVIFNAPQPSNSDPLKAVRQNGVIQDGLGNWIENWELVDIFSDIVVDGVTVTKETQETEYLTTRNNNQWVNVRTSRDQLLKDTDWVSIRAADTGTPMSTEWSTYRQALRDVTEQTDPFNITWPVKPT